MGIWGLAVNRASFVWLLGGGGILRLLLSCGYDRKTRFQRQLDHQMTWDEDSKW